MEKRQKMKEGEQIEAVDAVAVGVALGDDHAGQADQHGGGHGAVYGGSADMAGLNLKDDHKGNAEHAAKSGQQEGQDTDV